MLIPEVLMGLEESELEKVVLHLFTKWSHILPIEPAFHSEFRRWYVHWKREGEVPHISATELIAKHADEIFFPNVRELLKILAVLPIGSVEAERLFSCVGRIHTWLRSSLCTDKLSDLAVIAMQGHSVPVSTSDICSEFMKLHPHKMKPSLLFEY